MAHSDVAVVLDRTGLDITSGFCMCVFHRECMDGTLTCQRCLTRGSGIKHVTDRCCLRCAVFSADPLCRRCLGAFCDLVLSSLRLQDGIELEEVVQSFLPLNFPPQTAIPWIMVQLMTKPALPFVIVEEKGSFIGRTRAWAVVELWRKMLAHQKEVTIKNMDVSETVLVAALDLLSRKEMIAEGGKIRMLDSRVPVSDDGYYALGSTLCGGGLLDEIMYRTNVEKFFVPCRNDFVYYSHRTVLAEIDTTLLDQWQSAYAAICVKRLTEDKNESRRDDC